MWYVRGKQAQLAPCFSHVLSVLAIAVSVSGCVDATLSWNNGSTSEQNVTASPTPSPTPSPSASPSPSPSPPPGPIAAAGNGHTCVIKTGQLYCFGANYFGQLGLDDSVQRNAPVQPLAIPANVKSVFAGYVSTCVTFLDGSLKCWGNNSGGRLGLGDIQDRGLAPGAYGMSALSSLSFGSRSVFHFAMGYVHSCAVLDDRLVRCWGNNGDGQLGYGDILVRGDSVANEPSVLPPVDLGGTAHFVAAGWFHSCAILTDGSVKCWGNNGSGQLGQGHFNSMGDQAGEMASLTGIPLGESARFVAAGGAHTCAILQSGQVKCWGNNAYGQLGVNDTASRGGAPADMAGLTTVDLNGRTAVQLALGDMHSCALLSDQTVKCWGSGQYGQTGYGTLSNRGDWSIPMANFGSVGLGGPVKSIAAGLNHTCAVLLDDSVKCWGYNGYGGLGDGTVVDSMIPVTVLPPL